MTNNFLHTTKPISENIKNPRSGLLFAKETLLSFKNLYKQYVPKLIKIILNDL